MATFILAGALMLDPSTGGLYLVAAYPDGEDEANEGGAQVIRQLDGLVEEWSASKSLRPLSLSDFAGAGGVVPSGLAPGETLETISVNAFVRREQINKERPDEPTVTIIDFYSPWNANGTFGAWKRFSHWLNTQEDVDAFETATGIKVADMKPILNQGYTTAPAIERVFGKPPLNVEVVLEKPVDVRVRKIPVSNEDGTPALTDKGRPKYNTRFHSWV